MSGTHYFVLDASLMDGPDVLYVPTDPGDSSGGDMLRALDASADEAPSLDMDGMPVMERDEVAAIDSDSLLPLDGDG